MNHVLYCDNFFSSGPLVEMLSIDRIFVVGTIRKRALGFPAVLKTATPTAGTRVHECEWYYSTLCSMIAKRFSL